MSTNILLDFTKTKDFGTPDLAVPFDKIKTEDFIPALDKALEIARTHLTAIRNNPEPATFENTTVDLESASEIADTIAGVYFNLFSAEASKDLQALAKEISPKLAAFGLEISLDEKLFQRTKEVYDNRKSAGLTTEQIMLVEKNYKSFVRNGAMLPADKKERLKAIDQEQAEIGPQFSENSLNATNAFELWIEDKKDLEGLPEGAVEAAADDAAKKGKPGQWMFSLQYPSVIPFLTYAKNRALREKIWRANSSKAFGGEFDNQKIVLRMLQLRDERAKLLGFANHAAFVLEERMAQNPDTVFKFLDSLYAPSKKAAESDIKELTEFAKAQDGITEIQGWDYFYYVEKLKASKYAFDSEDLRPYFKLENVVAGVFEHARRLYNLKFTERKDLPVYHADVKAYEVSDEKTGENIGLFYADYFPRETKRGGAWMTNFRDQGLFLGKVRRPHVAIVCNFTKPTATKPSLLSYQEVQTLFHEFGHALHGLLSHVNYRSVSGANVYWDFVELPSQIMENWVREKEGLDIFARHFETNAPIPAELIEKMIRAEKFQKGYQSLRQLSLGLLDMRFHTADPATITDVDAFEEKATADTRVLPRQKGTNTACSFGHIFAGGYSAGYYSYKWAEVLDADAFEFFKEKGLFNAEVATSFRQNILSRGGTEHPMTLYKRFRGREPDAKALLRRDGLTA